MMRVGWAVLFPMIVVGCIVPEVRIIERDVSERGDGSPDTSEKDAPIEQGEANGEDSADERSDPDTADGGSPPLDASQESDEPLDAPIQGDADAPSPIDSDARGLVDAGSLSDGWASGDSGPDAGSGVDSVIEDADGSRDAVDGPADADGGIADVDPPYDVGRDGSNGYAVVAKHSGRCMTVIGNLPFDGTNIAQWACDGAPSQNYRLEAALASTYRLISNSTNKCVAIDESGPPDGANVNLWSCDGSPGQLFTLEPSSDGSFTLINPNSGTCVAVDGAGMGDLANILMSICNGADHQRWFFNAIAPAGHSQERFHELTK
jgi:hypothetical protein